MIRIKLTILLFFALTHIFAQQPATEIRAVWLTTNWGLDWPKTKTSKEQKQELIKILDEFEADNYNLVLFQARAQGRAFYNSKIELPSPYFDSSNGFDPLAFAIEECHKRGMECHAWITTFPVEKAKLSKRGVLLETRPSYYKRVEDRWFLDPGRPETKARLVSIAEEIVNNYDVDGLHLDYIRYPDNPKKFDDLDTYRKYGEGQNKTIWRNKNVNQIVFEIYDAVKAIKDWVQVSSSPLGKYRALHAGDGWTALESVHQDAAFWMYSQKHDLVFPMMYHRGNKFAPYVDDWLKHSYGRIIVPGLGLYQMEEAKWQADEIIEQINYTRKTATMGQAYFRARQVLDNTKGIKKSISSYYKYPAKLPPLTWLNETIPESPKDLQVYKDDENYLVIEWNAPNEQNKYTYNIYFSLDENIDTSVAEGILSAGQRENYYAFPASVGEYGFYYTVTASDRYHNESIPVESGYFVHSQNIY